MLLRGESTRPVDMLLSRLRTCESQPLETTVLPVATPEAVQQIRVISAESASTFAAEWRTAKTKQLSSTLQNAKVLLSWRDCSGEAEPDRCDHFFACPYPLRFLSSFHSSHSISGQISRQPLLAPPQLNWKTHKHTSTVLF